MSKRRGSSDSTWSNHLFVSADSHRANQVLDEFAKGRRDQLFGKGLPLAPRKPSDLLDVFQGPDAPVPHSFLVIKNVHQLARATDAPERYYRELLEIANYLAEVRQTPVLLSDVGWPSVFLQANLSPSLWTFVDCDNARPVRPSPQGPQLNHGYYVATAPAEADVVSPLDSGAAQLKTLQDRLKSKIVGQDEAVRRFSEEALISLSLEKVDGRPRGVFLLVGTSGVGKTEMCRQLARFLPGYRFLQINMAEHADKAAVDKLIGLGRGFEDSEQGGLLTEPIRQHPKHVVLLDELDHAHQSVIRLLYKVLEGDITDGRGRHISFADCVIAMTTNAGVTGQAAAERHVIEAALQATPEGREFFSTAFLGRIPSIVECRSLALHDHVEIARRYCHERLVTRYAALAIDVRFGTTGAALPFYSAEYLAFELFALASGIGVNQGARRLLQAVEEHLIRQIELLRITSQEPLRTVTIRAEPYLPDLEGLSYDSARVLVVDDDPDSGGSIGRALGLGGVTVDYSAFDADRVREHLTPHRKQDAVALMFLDLVEGTNVDRGRQFYKEVRGDLGPVPVCLLSSLPEGPHRDKVVSRLEAAGFAGYVSKSASPDALRDVVVTLLRQRYCEAKADVLRSTGRTVRLSAELPAEHSEDVNVVLRLEVGSAREARIPSQVPPA